LMLQSSDPCWVKDDLAIIQWIYTCISTKVFNLVSDDDALPSSGLSSIALPGQLRCSYKHFFF
jgi:hypothetical protein